MSKEFTKNEMIALMHEDTAGALRLIADFVEKWEMSREEVVKYLREISNQKDAQSVVVRLRDEL